MKARVFCRVELEMDAKTISEAKEKAQLMLSTGIHTEDELIVDIKIPLVLLVENDPN